MFYLNILAIYLIYKKIKQKRFIPFHPVNLSPDIWYSFDEESMYTNNKEHGIITIQEAINMGENNPPIYGIMNKVTGMIDKINIVKK
jgi:hypothetical protein